MVHGCELNVIVIILGEDAIKRLLHNHFFRQSLNRHYGLSLFCCISQSTKKLVCTNGNALYSGMGTSGETSFRHSGYLSMRFCAFLPPWKSVLTLLPVFQWVLVLEKKFFSQIPVPDRGEALLLFSQRTKNLKCIPVQFMHTYSMFFF